MSLPFNCVLHWIGLVCCTYLSLIKIEPSHIYRNRCTYRKRIQVNRLKPTIILCVGSIVYLCRTQNAVAHELNKIGNERDTSIQAHRIR